MSATTTIAEIQKNGRERVRVALDEVNGLVDVRVTRPGAGTDTYMTTGKGVSLKVEKLPELIAALQAAGAEAMAQGLLPESVLQTHEGPQVGISGRGPSDHSGTEKTVSKYRVPGPRATPAKGRS